MTQFARKILFRLSNIRSPYTLKSYGVNFTNPLAQSAIAPANRVCCNQFHQQNFAQLYQYTLRPCICQKFSVFWESRKLKVKLFQSSKLDRNKTGVSNVRKFRKTYRKFSRNSSCPKIIKVQNPCPKITV